MEPLGLQDRKIKQYKLSNYRLRKEIDKIVLTLDNFEQNQSLSPVRQSSHDSNPDVQQREIQINNL